MNSSSNSTNDDMQITVSWDIDTWPDLSYLGKYTDDADAPGAIDRAAAGYFIGRDQYRYFVPAISEDEHYRGLITMINPKNPAKKPYGKRTARAMARRYVLEDLARMEAYEKENWSMLVCRVLLSWKGLDIGRAALWGIESDSDYSYFVETVTDLVWEAHAEAVQTLADLNSADQLPQPDVSEAAIEELLHAAKGDYAPFIPRKVAA